MKTKYYLTTFAFNLVVVFCANSQIAISHVDEIPKIRRGTTYIVMKDPYSDKSKPYVNVFKNYWTISKLKFITYDEVEKYLSPESSFFSINGYEVTTTRTGNGFSYSNTYIYLKLWTCDEEFFKKSKKKKTKEDEFGDDHQVEVARIELFTDFKALMKPDLLFQSEYDGGGHIRNWSPGILRNYIKILMNYLESGKKRDLFVEDINSQELAKLKKEVLYVPDYVLIKFKKYTGNETKRHEERKLFKGYDFKYKIISAVELSQKILSGKTEFYYLIYVKGSSSKYINIINSRSGEIVYSTFAYTSYNIRPKNLKHLSDKIQKIKTLH